MKNNKMDKTGKKNIQGTTDLVIIVLALGVTVLIGTLLYMVFTGNTSLQTQNPFNRPQQIQTTPTPTISNSDDVETMETELESTTTGSFEADIQELEQDATAL